MTIKVLVKLPIGLKDRMLLLPITLSGMLDQYIIHSGISKPDYTLNFDNLIEHVVIKKSNSIIDNFEPVCLMLSKQALKELSNWDRKDWHYVIQQLLLKMESDILKMLSDLERS